MFSRYPLIHHTAAQAQTMAQNRVGAVQTYDETRHLATVLIQPEGILTGFIPIKTLGVGNGFGIKVAPVEGTWCFLEPQEGDPDAYVIGGFLFNDEDQPPEVPSATGSGNVPLKAGEIAIVAPNGAVIRLNADGSAYMAFPAGLDISGSATLDGNTSAGNLSASSGWTGTFTDIAGTNFFVMNGVIVGPMS